MKSLSDLRRELAEARDALRRTKDAVTVAQAQAEQRAIDDAGGSKALGSNETERARALTIALAKDVAYNAALDALRRCERHIEDLEADLEELKDARRDREWAIRARIADALLSAGVQTDSGAEEPIEGRAFDDVVWGVADAQTTRAAAAVPEQVSRNAADEIVSAEALVLAAAQAAKWPTIQPDDPPFFDNLPF